VSPQSIAAHTAKCSKEQDERAWFRNRDIREDLMLSGGHRRLIVIQQRKCSRDAGGRGRIEKVEEI
jgi:hypothetical protein